MLSVFSQRNYTFYHQHTPLDVFRTNSGNVIGSNPSMVIPLLANQDLTPMLVAIVSAGPPEGFRGPGEKERSGPYERSGQRIFRDEKLALGNYCWFI